LAIALTAPPRVPYERNAVEQLAGVLGRKHGRLAFSHDVFRTAYGVGRIHINDVTDHPVEQHTERGQVLPHRRQRKRLFVEVLVLQVLDEGCNVVGLDRGEFSDAARLAPLREAARCI
jgi:hypothetical protein